MARKLNYLNILGVDDQFSLSEKIINAAALVMIASAILCLIFLAPNINLHPAYNYSFKYMAVANVLVLIFNRYYRKFNIALGIFLSIELAMLYSDFVGTGGLVGTSPIFLMVCHMLNYNMLHIKHHPLYFLCSTSLIFIAIGYNLINPDLSAPLQYQIFGRIGEILSVDLLGSAALWLFKRQDYTRSQKLKEINDHQKQLIESIEDDFFIVQYDRQLKPYYHSHSFNSIFPEIAPNQIDRLWAQLIDPHRNNQVREQTIKINGKNVHLKINQKVFNPTTARQYTQIIVQDITQQKNHEENLYASLRKESRLNKAKNEFITMVSHQFRTPLTTIQSAHQLIAYQIEQDIKKPPTKYQPRFNQISESIESLTGMMERLLDFGRIEADDLQPSYQKIDLLPLINRQIDQRKNDREIHLSIAGIKQPVYADANLLEHVIINLISNAIKYSEQPIEIKVHFQAADYQIAFIDQGIGISPPELERLFEPFFRAKNTENFKGTGIGLSFVKKFVELHHGNVSVQSKPSEGSKFMITIPYLPTESANRSTQKIDLPY